MPLRSQDELNDPPPALLEPTANLDDAASRQARYLADQGCACPYCQSRDIEGGYIQTDQGCAAQTVTCASCQASWTDIYILTGIDVQ